MRSLPSSLHLAPLLLVAACAATPVDPYDPGSGGTGDGGPAAPAMMPTPFGSHRLMYPAGTIRPTGAQPELDAAVAGFYDQWKAKYLIANCGGQVIRTGGGTGAGNAMTVSEGHGYGMLITAIMAGHDARAQELFDGLYKVFRAQPSNINRQLMAWAIGSDCKAIQPANSATDGDLDIAFALLLANRQWGSAGAIDYAGEARKVIAAIGASEMNATTGLPLLGDWARQSALAWATRPSDFMLDHFRAFGALTGSAGQVQPRYRPVARLRHGHPDQRPASAERRDPRERQRRRLRLEQLPGALAAGHGLGGQRGRSRPAGPAADERLDQDHHGRGSR
jgi:hypothetical protein